MSVSLFIPFLLFQKRTKIISMIYLFIIYVPSFINLSHILIFNSEISSCSFMTMFETNFQEAMEFFKHFCSKKLIINTITFWSFPIISLMFFSATTINIAKYKKYLITFFIITYGVFSFGDPRYKFPFEKLAWNYIEYEIDEFRNKNLLESRHNLKFSDIKSSIPKSSPETYVVVIGESVNKEHMGIYGSKNKTTPNFDKIKDELKIFSNSRSSHCHTQKALKGALCFNEDFKNGDIITFFKQAGFKTFWFSNQYTSGNCDNLISMIGSLADSKEFINKSHYRTKLSSNFDEKLVDYFAKALKDPANKKIIFIHLLGSHLPYSKRYPGEFEVIKSKTSTTHSLEVAQYDNSILYTDYVLNKVLGGLKALNTNSYLLYFSDHGEDVTEDPNSSHSHVSSLSTPEMFDIPLIVWSSPKYRELNSKFINNWDTSKSYKTKDMIHSIINLSRLESSEYNKRKSIFER